MNFACRLLVSVALWIVVTGTSGCTHDFSVHRVGRAPAAVTGLRANMTCKWSPEQCWHILREGGQAGRRTAPATAAQESRRRATERLIELYAPALLAAPGRALQVPAGSGRFFSLSLRRGEGPGGVEPSRFTALEPVDHFAVSNADQHSGTPGEGDPLVGTLRPVLPVNVSGLVAPRPVAGFERAVTAVAVIGKNSSAIVLDLYDPHTTGRARGPGGKAGPLAADYTTPLALDLAHFRPQRRGFRGLLRGGDYFPDTGMYALEEPTPDKVPLVLVHGLISDPGDFHVLVNDFAGDSQVRTRYQVWFFYYPTSLPLAYAAMLLREDFEACVHQLDPAGTHPALHRAVLVGHSMGGLLCRLAVSDGGNRYYRHFFRQPVGELRLSPADRELVRRVFYYRACPDVAEVIFIATPHRGSRLAGGLLGTTGRVLMHMPGTVRLRLGQILARNQNALTTKRHPQPGSSLDSLTPRSPIIAAVNEMPMRTGVKLHSILGDQGRGGTPERSSDGVVPYTSSHLPQVASELLVPASHTGTLKRRETVAELIRILR